MSRKAVTPVSPAAKAVGLLRALMSSRTGLTAAMIRERISDYHGLSAAAFERAFERDKAILRSIGVDLDVSQLDADQLGEVRYRIDPARYQLPDLQLTDTERSVVGLAASAVAQGSWGNHARRAATRLGLEPGHMAGQNPEVTWTGATALIPPPEAAEPLIMAALGHYPVSFTYQVPGLEPLTREVLPWGVGQRRGRWYLFAGDVGRATERVFRLDRIQSKVVRAQFPKDDYVEDIYGRRDKFSMRHALETMDNYDARVELIVAVPTGRGGTLRREAQLRGSQDGVELLQLWAEDDVAVEELAAAGAAILSARSVTQSGREQELAAGNELNQVIRDRLQAAVRAHEGKAEVPRVRAASGGRPSTEQVLADSLSLIAAVTHEGVDDLDELATALGLTRDGIRRLVATIRLGAELSSSQAPELHPLSIDEDAGRVRLCGATNLAEPLNVSLREAAALLMGLDALAGVPGMSGSMHEVVEAVSQKIRSTRGELQDFGTVVAIAVGGVDYHAEHTAETLSLACQEHRAVLLHYAGSHGTTERRLDPLRILHTGEVTYVQGWCHLRGALRNFRLDRIEALTVLEETFDPNDQPYRQPATGLTPAADEASTSIVGFYGEARRRMSSFRPEATGDLPGGVATCIRVGSPQTLARYAASTGGNIVLLDPTDLRDRVHAELCGLQDQARTCRKVGAALMQRIRVDHPTHPDESERP